jgi:hypothetical protein
MSWHYALAQALPYFLWAGAAGVLAAVLWYTLPMVDPEEKAKRDLRKAMRRSRKIKP